MFFFPCFSHHEQSAESTTHEQASERASRCVDSRIGPDGSNDTPASLLELAGERVMGKRIEMEEGSEGK